MPEAVVAFDSFWDQPLGAWIKDCLCGSDPLLPETAWRPEDRRGTDISFDELCDGFVFNLLFVYIDSDSLNLIAVRNGTVEVFDSAGRTRQFGTLIRNIYNFYRCSAIGRKCNNSTNIYGIVRIEYYKLNTVNMCKAIMKCLNDEWLTNSDGGVIFHQEEQQRYKNAGYNNFF
uniref:Uncharacterized protein n=1 Tax=Syphacia muris TaxID=451379 RepID=A0A0N5ARA5_9BILA